MVSTTIKADGDTARNGRRILSEHYDLEIKYRHTPDGKDLRVELVLYPKGSVPPEKPPKRKNNIIPEKRTVKKIVRFYILLIVIAIILLALIVVIILARKNMKKKEAGKNTASKSNE